MTAIRFRVSTLLFILLAAAGSGSCSRSFSQLQADREHAQNHVIVVRIDHLRGKCYAPHSYQFNPALVLYDFPGVNRWIVTPVRPHKVEGLAAMLAAQRAVFRSGWIKLVIPKDAIVTRPFYFQFVAFPCDAPPIVRENLAGVDVVSMAFDLPPYFPPGYRPGVPGSARNATAVEQSLGPFMTNAG